MGRSERKLRRWEEQIPLIGKRVWEPKEMKGYEVVYRVCIFRRAFAIVAEEVFREFPTVAD